MNLRHPIAFLALAALAACGGGKSSSSGTCSDPGTGASRTVSGNATYDFVPAVPTAGGAMLDFAHAVARPIRNAVVLVSRGTGVLGVGSSDAAGHYSVTFGDTGCGLPRVSAIARTAAAPGVPPVEVRDNTDAAGSTWAVGDLLQVGATTLDLHAAHGWNLASSSYDPLRRAAAPFAILDSMTTAGQAFLAVRPAVVFPALVVNWSPRNVAIGPTPANGGLAAGNIGTSHFNPALNQIFILGKEGADTDEFDNHVIVHEWGHYFEHNLSRSDSPGGPHSFGDICDPRLSFGEGYGDGIAAVLLDDPIYVDTNWSGGGGFSWDTETDPGDVGGLTDDPNKGVFSEASVMRFIYDVFDPANEAWDGVDGGLGVVYDVLTGPERTTDALTTIGSFVAGLKAHPSVAGNAAGIAAIDALLAHYNIGPLTDGYGTGDASLAAMWYAATIPSSGPVALSGGYAENMAPQNLYVAFTGPGAPGTTASVTITATSAQDVALKVYQPNPPPGVSNPIAFADSYYGGTTPETVHFTAQGGKAYVLNVYGFGSAPAGAYGVNLTFASP